MNHLDVCNKCDFLQCMAIILDHPEQVVKCIHFGHLKEYVNSLELPSECGMLSPSVIDKFNECGCTSFIYTIDQLKEMIQND